MPVAELTNEGHDRSADAIAASYRQSYHPVFNMVRCRADGEAIAAVAALVPRQHQRATGAHSFRMSQWQLVGINGYGSGGTASAKSVRTDHL